mmetsp:Transcript_14323/g.25063  ORF Transcript_14323/g.25063 Transcript_14323/m.25063 type:complete len:81 (+) Transcript_14323:1593-1835(+)
MPFAVRAAFGLSEANGDAAKLLVLEAVETDVILSGSDKTIGLVQTETDGAYVESGEMARDYYWIATDGELILAGQNGREA